MSINYKNFKINAVYTGAKLAPWSGKYENWNHHTITVYNTENKKRTSFDFWASNMKPNIEGNKEEILLAFQNFLSDGLAGCEDFNSFCWEFGYDTDSIKAFKTYKVCEKSTKKLIRILGNESYISDLYNDLTEEGYC